MRRSPFPPRTHAARRWVRARNAPGTLARLALVCYLMPLILVVFAIGGLAIGVVRLQQVFRMLADALPGRASSLRGLLASNALPRKVSYARGTEVYQKPRSLR